MRGGYNGLSTSAFGQDKALSVVVQTSGGILNVRKFTKINPEIFVFFFENPVYFIRLLILINSLTPSEALLCR